MTAPNELMFSRLTGYPRAGEECMASGGPHEPRPDGRCGRCDELLAVPAAGPLTPGGAAVDRDEAPTDPEVYAGYLAHLGVIDATQREIARLGLASKPSSLLVEVASVVTERDLLRTEAEYLRSQWEKTSAALATETEIARVREEARRELVEAARSAVKAFDELRDAINAGPDDTDRGENARAAAEDALVRLTLAVEACR